MRDGVASLDLNDKDVERLLLSPGPNVAQIYQMSSEVEYDIQTGRTSKSGSANFARIGGALAAKSFLSVPIIYRGEPIGRLYIFGCARRFTSGDVEFLLQVIEQVLPVLDNVRLVDRLASDAAEQERQRLARDIHDSVIQPYVGLQMGLMALRKRFAHGDVIRRELDQLYELAKHEVTQLRHYLDGLKSDESEPGVLFPSIRRFASKYSSATGIAVELSGAEDLKINDRLAAEAFQMIAEGLSNVRRHTGARTAKIDLGCQDGHLILKIANNNSESEKIVFKPVTITERAQALGGTAQVYTDAGNTTVEVRIPL
jgi:signal transduction histidine kinase